MSDCISKEKSERKIRDVFNGMTLEAYWKKRDFCFWRLSTLIQYNDALLQPS